MMQTKTAFTIDLAILAIVASVVNLFACCESVAAADNAAVGDVSIIYQSQTDLFAAGQGTAPFLIEQNTSHTSTPPAATPTTSAARSYLTLLSMAPVGKSDNVTANTETQSATNPLAIETRPATDASEFQANNQPSITDLADTLQWTILLLTAVAAAVIGVHRLTKHKQKTQISQRMEYQGCLPVRGQFSMHLVTIIDRQFLVTTDRSGVKNVNALNDWDQFSTPVDPSVDDQFPELSMETKPRHHG